MIKTPAIVIKETDYRDNDKMLTLFSPKYGRIDALSRGCKKPSGKLMASSQMFVCGSYQFNEKSGKQYLAGCEIAHPFFGLRNSYEKLYTAYLMAEVTERFILAQQEDTRLYTILINALFSLENDLNTPEYLLPFFLILLSDAAGLRPYTQDCLECHDQDACYFNFESGGLMCASCAAKMDGEKKRISREAIGAMNRILSLPSKAMRTKSPDALPGDLTEAMVRYLEIMTNTRFKS